MDLKLAVDIDDQSVTLFENKEPVKCWDVSTAKNGIGNEMGSYKTPTGLFKICEKIGEGAPEGTIFRARKSTGEIWSAKGPMKDSQDDLILTRILWLEGCEEANANTKERFIYFHGTNHEEFLGEPASQGCIRMSNRDVMDLFDRVPVGTPVLIY